MKRCAWERGVFESVTDVDISLIVVGKNGNDDEIYTRSFRVR